jgi:osmotically-inducible protein OsmY
MSGARALLAAALAAALLPGCAVALLGAAGGAAYMAIEDRRSSSTQIDDKELELRAASRIEERLGDKAHVNVSSYNRAVLITGEVPDENARIEAERIAQALPNVRAVSNELQVGELSSLGARTNDSAITTKVKARLLDSKRVNPLHVKVITEAAVVYLMGVVTEAEAEEAVEVARTTGGVRKVVKLFEYCSPADEMCKPRTASPERTKPPA